MIEWKQDGEDLVAISHDREFLGGQKELMRLKSGKAPAVAVGDVPFTGKSTIQMFEKRITHADLTDTDNGDSQAINIGPVLPPGTIMFAVREVEITTLFSGGSASAVNLVLGIASDPDSIITGPLDIFTGAATGKQRGTNGVRSTGDYSGEQLIATIDIDAGHPLADLTAGDLTVRVWYATL